MVEPSEMAIKPFKLIDRTIIGKIVGYLDPPSAVCLALTCKRLQASVYNICGTSKLKEICPRDVRSKITASLHPYNIFTGMLQSGAYNIDNLKLCPELSEPDDVIPLATVREVAWAQDASAECGPQGSVPSPGSDRKSYRSPFGKYQGKDLIISVEWYILVACIVQWIGGEYKYCDKHGGWVKGGQPSQVPCRRCSRALGPQSIPGEFESQDRDD